MAIENRVITFKGIFESDSPLGISAIISITLSVLFVVGFTVYSELYVYVLPVLIALPLVFLIFTNPKIWLYILVLSLVIFFHGGDDGVSVFDYLIGLYFLGSTVLWFLWKVFISREKVVLNWGDWAILIFYFLLLFNFFIAYLNDVDPVSWLREFLLISVILIYFPVRDNLKSENDIKKFLILLGLVIIAAGIYQVFEYYRKVNTDIVYAYELKSSITINQTLYTAASIFSFILAFSQTNKFKEIFIVGLTSLYVVFLISTFSRTFWLILAAAIILMFFFLPASKKTLFLTYLGIISFVLILSAFLFMREKADIALGVAFSRLESTTEGKKDISLIARFKEWEKLQYHIFQNPLGGNGLAKEFSFYFPINQRARHTTTIHNGYLWIAYRAGIPLALLFLFFIIHYNIRAGRLITKADTPILKAVVIGSFAIFICLYVINMTSAQYFTRDGMIVTAFSVAIIGAVEKLLKYNNDKKLLI